MSCLSGVPQSKSQVVTSSSSLHVDEQSQSFEKMHLPSLQMEGHAKISRLPGQSEFTVHSSDFTSGIVNRYVSNSSKESPSSTTISLPY